MSLRKFRADNGLTIPALAKRLKVSNASVSRIERGEQWPREALAKRILKVTNGSVNLVSSVQASASAERKARKA